MARKNPRFDWTAEDGFAERVVRPNRSKDREAVRELERLAIQLADLTRGQRRQLPLDDALLHALDGLAALGRGPARKRQRLRVTTLLMSVDREALDAALGGEGAAQDHLWELERWRTRIVAEGDPAVQAFVEAYPSADRRQLRRLGKQGQGETEAAARARKKLFAVLKAAG
ncbi:MAG: ribosome-associated protein [Myxococcota bacterium]|jgi:ribosome-associated protein